MPFAGLNQAAFDAYAPEKWSSNMHNLARMRAKEVVLALADDAQAPHAELLRGLVRAASDEVPNIMNQKKVDAQWVYWARDQDERAALSSILEKIKLDESALQNIMPQDKHVSLALVLRKTGLWVGLRVAAGASVDRRNLGAELEQATTRAAIAQRLAALPAGATVTGNDHETSSAEVDEALLALHASALEHGHPVWQVGYTLDAAAALALGSGVAAWASERLGALVPLYRFVAWSKDNDHIEVAKQLAAAKAEARKQSVGYNPGDKARIMSGIFTGKVGVVQETDGKANVKLLVGKMSVVVPGTELTPAS